MTGPQKTASVQLTGCQYRFLNDYGIDLGKHSREAIDKLMCELVDGQCIGCGSFLYGNEDGSVGVESDGITVTGESRLGDFFDLPDSFVFRLCDSCADPIYAILASDDQEGKQDIDTPFSLEEYEDINHRRYYSILQEVLTSLSSPDDIGYSVLHINDSSIRSEYVRARECLRFLINGIEDSWSDQLGFPRENVGIRSMLMIMYQLERDLPVFQTAVTESELKDKIRNLNSLLSVSLSEQAQMVLGHYSVSPSPHRNDPKIEFDCYIPTSAYENPERDPIRRFGPTQFLDLRSEDPLNGADSFIEACQVGFQDLVKELSFPGQNPTV